MNITLKKILISSASLLMIASIDAGANYNFNNASASRYSYVNLPKRTKGEVNSFYRYAKLPAIKYSPNRIKRFYRNGAHKIYMYEEYLSKANHNVRHTNWLIRQHKHNHRYVRQLKKRMKGFKRQVSSLSQKRNELLYAERGTYRNYRNKYNHEAINTPNDVENSAPRFNSSLGRKDADGIFGGGTSYEYSRIMAHRKNHYLSNPNYRGAFIDKAESYGYSRSKAINVLNAFQRHQAHHTPDYKYGWENGLYGNQDENLSNDRRSTNPDFQSGWYDGIIVYNDGDLPFSKAEYKNFKSQINQEQHPVINVIKNGMNDLF